LSGIVDASAGKMSNSGLEAVFSAVLAGEPQGERILTLAL
jgi:hypothetical protein